MTSERNRDDGMTHYLETNRRHWNEVTPIHARSDFYDVEGFKAGKSTLTSIELEELGDVSGMSMLHLQCHFGLDTMSWARLGAQVTGVDFSEEAIALARSLNNELDVGARFVLSNVYDLPDSLDEKLDIVDSHPFGNVIYNEDDATDLRPYYRYSDRDVDPMEFAPGPTYTDGSPELTSGTYEWNHSVGDILNSLISAGLTIEFFHEFHFARYRSMPMMERGEDGWWRLKDGRELVPFLFSLKPRK